MKRLPHWHLTALACLICVTQAKQPLVLQDCPDQEVKTDGCPSWHDTNKSTTEEPWLEWTLLCRHEERNNSLPEALCEEMPCEFGDFWFQADQCQGNYGRCWTLADTREGWCAQALPCADLSTECPRGQVDCIDGFVCVTGTCCGDENVCYPKSAGCDFFQS